MQRPTLQNIRIRSTRDALHVFAGVAREVLPLITRRLDAEERRSIIPGNVYVWEERGANTEATGLGMERWTDGMGWGPSRVRDEFLFYHQKESDLGEEYNNPLTPWAQMISVYPASHSRTPTETERLIKQTYSVHVTLPQDQCRGLVRKWHLTAYFSQQKLDSLNTIDSILGIGDVPVPEGWFKSARVGKMRRDHREASGSHLHPSPHLPPGSIPQNQLSLPANVTSIPPSTSHTKHHANNSYDSTRYRGSKKFRTRFSSCSPPPSEHSPCSSATPSPALGSTPLAQAGQLVPLEFLQSVSYQRREPIDEQLLRRLATHSITRPASVNLHTRGPT